MKTVARMITLIAPFAMCAAAVSVGVNRITPDQMGWVALIVAGVVGMVPATVAAHSLLDDWR